jgi:hypothetical protein
VAQCGRHETFFGPASVAIHDDGNVLRQCVGFLEGQGLVQWWGLILDFSSIGKSNGLRF